jgi:hypothetical protein
MSEQYMTYDLRCMRCDKISEYVFRSQNVNAVLTEQDLHNKKYRALQNPIRNQWCQKCKRETLQIECG